MPEGTRIDRDNPHVTGIDGHMLVVPKSQRDNGILPRNHLPAADGEVKILGRDCVRGQNCHQPVIGVPTVADLESRVADGHRLRNGGYGDAWEGFAGRAENNQIIVLTESEGKVVLRRSA